MNKCYIIAWRSLTTGFVGEGSVGFPLEVAQKLCKELDAKFPELVHWPRWAWDGEETA